MPATHPHPQLEMCTGGIHDSGSRPISNSSRSGERQPSRCSRASSCPSTRWSLPALPSAPPRRSAPPRSAPEADACPSPTSPHHPLDSHNASQPARGNRNTRSASHTVNHGRYLLFEWPAARLQSARAFHAVRRGGPATFTRQITRQPGDMPSFAGRRESQTRAPAFRAKGRIY
jgi:hypothetical protein